MTQLPSKQPLEEFAISFDFTDALPSGVTISSVTSIKALDQADGSDVSATVLDSTKQSNTTVIVSAWVQAGTSGHSYRITCLVLGTSGNVYELECVLPVEDIPITLPTTGQGLVTAPVLELVSLYDAKLHLKIETADTDDDELIKTLIEATREHVEDITRRALLTQTWDYCLDAWPDRDYIELPKGNLQSITSVKWKDDDGTETTLTENTDYLVETNGAMKGRIVLPYGVSWPSGTLYPSNPITIRYVCGWTTAALVPKKIKTAMLMILADLYENRGEMIAGMYTVTENKAAERLLASARLW